MGPRIHRPHRVCPWRCSRPRCPGTVLAPAPHTYSARKKSMLRQSNLYFRKFISLCLTYAADGRKYRIHAPYLKCCIEATQPVWTSQSYGQSNHSPDLSAQPAHVELARIDAVQGHRAAEGVVESQQQVHDRRLTRPGRAHQSHYFAGLDCEVVVLAHLQTSQ